MVKTGDTVFNVLLVTAMLLPLAPLLIIFLRRVYQHALLNLLRVVCLLAFIQSLVLYVPGLLKEDTSFAIAAFRLVDFVLLFYLFKLAASSQRIKDAMNFLLVAFISIILTIYILKGPGVFPVPIAMVQSAILSLLALLSLAQLSKDKTIILFREPLFWIAGGVLCYAAVFLFLEILLSNYPELSQQMQQDKTIVLYGATIFRYSFFIVAAMLAKEKGGS